MPGKLFQLSAKQSFYSAIYITLDPAHEICIRKLGIKKLLEDAIKKQLWLLDSTLIVDKKTSLGQVNPKAKGISLRIF